MAERRSGLCRLFPMGVMLVCALFAQQQEPTPPEEDEALTVKEYTFNPVQAAQEMKVGNYYFKKANYRAAANRFLEASKWDGTLAEAHLRLGETREKLKDSKAAAEAYSKYLVVAPDAKNAVEVRKRLDRLKR
ncbi:MAG: tetratricopeptide repeat protein [Bryobacteraceae bacterium]